MAPIVSVVGGGLAGCEAAWQIARRGLAVVLYEMRPLVMTPAHKTGFLAELVCSNSLGGDLPDRAPGLLKRELALLGSLILACARETAVPAGSALAVDRERFAELVTQRIEAHPLISVVREEVREIPGGVVVVAAGPLASHALSRSIAELTGQGHLYFYDAIAPIVAAESIDMSKAFRAGRYAEGADYINCPMSRDEYDVFVEALVNAEVAPLHGFELEDPRFFEGCLPIEVMARRGHLVLAHGPLSPAGIVDPRTGARPFAVVQLRQDNVAGTLYNMVGFQTNLRYAEQERVFRLIPGLERAQFVRYGQMHRNTFICSPKLLWPTLEMKERPGLFFAGQITGTEGYMASTASGLVAGINAARRAMGLEPLVFPRESMIGALMHYIAHADPASFQPMKPNFGLLPPLETPVRREKRGHALSERAMQALMAFLKEDDTLPLAAAVE
jgi:methylenetetrahydrofolate--tRNA-(uracil-5-)-methyltransferase